MFKKLIGGKSNPKNAAKEEYPPNFNPTKCWSFFSKLETQPYLAEGIDKGIQNMIDEDNKQILIDKKDFEAICKEFSRLKPLEK